MIPQTIGREHDAGKIASIQCVKDDNLDDLEIQGHCFLMLIIHEGSAYFQVGDTVFEAIGPCFVCFDEKEQPRLIRKHDLTCDSVYFHPFFLDAGMTFEQVRGNNYEQVATSHDMFLLRPFTDKNRFVFPLLEEYNDSLKLLFSRLENELDKQYDWYWSCRSRSYFLEMILILERAYGIIGQNDSEAFINKIVNVHLRNAVIYIESYYHENITLKSIAKAAALNHSTLTQLFKEELGVTPIEYLWRYRISVAKKHLEFSNLTIKDISEKCGFKTNQHFSRKFEEYTGTTPTAFRKTAVDRQKAASHN